jgi:hypothetical protein
MAGPWIEAPAWLLYRTSCQDSRIAICSASTNRELRLTTGSGSLGGGVVEHRDPRNTPILRELNEVCSRVHLDAVLPGDPRDPNPVPKDLRFRRLSDDETRHLLVCENDVIVQRLASDQPARRLLIEERPLLRPRLVQERSSRPTSCTRRIRTCSHPVDSISQREYSCRRRQNSLAMMRHGIGSRWSRTRLPGPSKSPARVLSRSRPPPRPKNPPSRTDTE